MTEKEIGSVDDALELLREAGRPMSRNAFYEAVKRGDVPHSRWGKTIIVSLKRMRQKLHGEA
jgi:hypothetical protein